ncbi:hypothetical protein Scep_020722 [Stephania cephalantha]|uniref:RING-type E3 ubiquitin transferase n=1 Tax=Stephania cephalantha TaxID=152367 RepID=A0AAP0ID75_9MAGN
MAMASPENRSHIDWGPSPASLSQSPSPIPVDFSPPLIAMVVVAAAAFLVVSYFRLISRHVLPPVRRWRRQWSRWRQRDRRRNHSRNRSRNFSDLSDSFQHSPQSSNAVFESSAFQLFSSPYGLDDDVIKTIPLSIYTVKSGRSNHSMNSYLNSNSKGSNSSGRRSQSHDCAVCLLEFEENDYVRTLPACAHAFHVDCIDIWLRSHANCPLCRAGIFRPESPFVPLMAGRIRPSLDDRALLESILTEPRYAAAGAAVAEISDGSAGEIVPVDGEGNSMRRSLAASEDRMNYSRDFVLKRSYSFGFERSLAADRMVLEAATATPWRYRRGSFWSKRPSPFTSVSKHRVFSFRSYRGMTKSPFFRRRQSTTFFPMSESSVRFSGSVGGGGSSRRSKSITSPMFMMRSSAAMASFSSSRMRCGDLEALLSPERLNGR